MSNNNSHDFQCICDECMDEQYEPSETDECSTDCSSCEEENMPFWCHRCDKAFKEIKDFVDFVESNGCIDCGVWSSATLLPY